jgi:succinate dehydrogenase / fumarate reductase flavoprotein subunit
MTAIKKALPRRRFDAVLIGAGGSGIVIIRYLAA